MCALEPAVYLRYYLAAIHAQGNLDQFKLHHLMLAGLYQLNSLHWPGNPVLPVLV